MKQIDAINLALNMLIQVQRISLLVSKMQTEGRSQLRLEEEKAVTEDRDAAIARLEELTKEESDESRND